MRMVWSKAPLARSLSSGEKLTILISDSCPANAQSSCQELVSHKRTNSSFEHVANSFSLWENVAQVTQSGCVTVVTCSRLTLFHILAELSMELVKMKFPKGENSVYWQKRSWPPKIVILLCVSKSQTMAPLVNSPTEINRLSSKENRRHQGSMDSPQCSTMLSLPVSRDQIRILSSSPPLATSVESLENVQARTPQENVLFCSCPS